MLGSRQHRCEDCAVDGRGVQVVGQHLLHSLLLADDAARWQDHLSDAGLAAVGRLLARGPQLVVTSHERPMREIQALALLLRNAGMPLRVLVNDGSTRRPVDFALTGRSPLHLVSALGAVRAGDSVLFVLWRAPMRPRGMLPWEAPDVPARPAVGPVVLARRTGVPVTVARIAVTGRTAARIELVERPWVDPGGDLDDAARDLTRAVEPVAAPVARAAV